MENVNMQSADRLESFGIYQLARQLFKVVDHIIGGLTNAIRTIEAKQNLALKRSPTPRPLAAAPSSPATRPAPPVTRHPSPATRPSPCP